MGFSTGSRLWLRKHSEENVFPLDWNENEAEGDGGNGKARFSSFRADAAAQKFRGERYDEEAHGH